MTRKEAVLNLVLMYSLAMKLVDNSDFPEALEMAVKSLEQEPVIDKIRAEIKALSNANPSYWHSGDMVEREDALEIIDKYKKRRNNYDRHTNYI